MYNTLLSEHSKMDESEFVFIFRFFKIIHFFV